MCRAGSFITGATSHSESSKNLRGTSHMVVSATLVQNRRVKRLQCYRIKDLCSTISSGLSMGKSRAADVCLCVCVSKHFRLWSPNGWSDRDERIFIRCTGTAENDGARCGPIGCTWHVPRTISQTPAKINGPTLQVKPTDGFGSNLVGR